jgi:hypothetical protein
VVELLGGGGKTLGHWGCDPLGIVGPQSLSLLCPGHEVSALPDVSTMMCHLTTGPRNGIIHHRLELPEL